MAACRPTGRSCWQTTGGLCGRSARPPPAGGDHVARFGRAMRRGLISGPDLLAVLGTLDAFTTATVIRDAPDACPVSPRGRHEPGGPRGECGRAGDAPWHGRADHNMWRVTVRLAAAGHHLAAGPGGGHRGTGRRQALATVI